MYDALPFDLIIFMRSTIFILLACIPRVYGSYVGNPAFPKIPEEGLHMSKESYMSIKTGYIGDYVFDGKMKVNSSKLHHEVDQFQTLTNSGFLSFSYEERIEAYARLGCVHAKISHLPLRDLRVHYRTRSQYLWCLGFESILFERRNTIISLNLNYSQSSPEIRTITANGAALASHHARIDYSEWQAGVGMAYTIDPLIPYVGIHYSDSRARFKKLQSLKSTLSTSAFTMRSENKAGIFLGCSITPNKTIVVNVEVRLIDEEALTISGLIRF